MRSRALRGALLLGAVGVVAAGVALEFRDRWWPGPRPRIESTEARRLFNQGLRYQGRGYTLATLKLAEKQFREALDLEPGNPEIQARLAQLLVSVELQYPAPGRREEIRELARHALEQRADLAPAWMALGRVVLLEGRPEEAADAARRAKRSAPDEHGGYVLLADALLAQGRTAEGMAELRRGVEVGEGHIWARADLALRLFEQGRIDEAAVEYGKVLSYAPDFPAALSNLGAIYVFTGRYTESVPLLRRLLELRPDDDGAAGNLGIAYFYLGQLPEAIQAFRKAVDLAPEYTRHKRNLAEAYDKDGDAATSRIWFAEAVESAELALRASPHNLEARVDRAFSLAKLGRADDARASLEPELARRQDDMQLLYAMAQIEAMAGRTAQAYAYVERAVHAGYSREEFRRDECFRDLRDDPEFMALLLQDVP